MPIHGSKIHSIWGATLAASATSNSSGVRTEEYATAVLTMLTTAVQGTTTVVVQSAHEDVSGSYATTFTTTITATGNKALLVTQLGKYTRVSVSTSGAGGDNITATMYLDCKT